MEIQIKDKIQSMTISTRKEFLFMTSELVYQFTCINAFRVYANGSFDLHMTGLCIYM